MYYMCQQRLKIHCAPTLQTCLNHGDGFPCLLSLKYSLLTEFFLNWQSVMYTSSSHFLTSTSCYRMQTQDAVKFFLLSRSNVFATHLFHCIPLVKDVSHLILMFIPRFSLSSHVKTESLYGIKSDFFFFLLCSKQNISYTEKKTDD